VELRTELFTPPPALDTASMPAILSVGYSTKAEEVVSVTYGSQLTISWKPKLDSGVMVDVTKVSLVAPGCATHGHNANQRLVWLPIVAKEVDSAARTGVLTVTLPTDKPVAPPQMYMLFLNNGKTYSRAWWVHLKDW
jgi:hypothetical protein